MTKRILAGVQRRHGTAMIAVTTDHQGDTPAKPSKVYPEELDRVLFQDQQSMQRDL